MLPLAPGSELFWHPCQPEFAEPVVANSAAANSATAKTSQLAICGLELLSHHIDLALHRPKLLVHPRDRRTHAPEAHVGEADGHEGGDRADNRRAGEDRRH